MHTVGKLAKEFGLSRTTLLYYDEIGLLVPTERSASNYRLYSESDRTRLANICRFRETGLSLLEIKRIKKWALAYDEK
jgi:DNA-binding transcriptional MerR regulator